jgi:hypothetical protein
MSNFRNRTASIFSIVGLAFLFIPTQAAHSESYAFVEVSFDSSFAKGGVYEYYGALVQEKNGAQTRALTSRPTNGNFKFTVPISDDPWRLYLSVLEPGAEKDGEAFAGRYPQKNNVGVTALTVKSIKIDKDLALAVKIPVSQKRILLKVIDASGSPIANSFSQASLTEKFSFTQSGLSWELESRVHANGETTYSTSGFFQYYFYEGSSFSLKVWDKGRTTEAAIPKSIKVLKDLEVVMCLPLNFPVGVRTLSSDCLQVQMDQELQAAAKVIADQAAADKTEIRSLLDSVASQITSLRPKIGENNVRVHQSTLDRLNLALQVSNESGYSEIRLLAQKTQADLLALEQKFAKQKKILKSVTITCVKGKLTKKVTAASPKCPSGYKKK